MKNEIQNKKIRFPPLNQSSTSIPDRTKVSGGLSRNIFTSDNLQREKIVERIRLTKYTSARTDVGTHTDIHILIRMHTHTYFFKAEDICLVKL